MKPDKKFTLLPSNISQINKNYIRARNVNFTGGWNISSVESAVAGLVTGNFRMISQLARVMQSDSAFSAALNKRVNAFTRSELYVYTDENSCDNSAIKYFIEQNINDILSELELERILVSYLTIGIGLGYLQWELQDNFWIPKLYSLDTENLIYQQSTETWEYYSYNDVLKIEPNDGTFILISKWRPGDLKGCCAELCKDWLMKKYAQNDWIETNQSLVNPYIIVTDDGTGVQSQEADINNLIAQIQSQKADRVMYVAPGMKIDIKDALPSYSSTTFSDILEQVDRKFQVSILGSNTSSEIVDQGSRATAEIHNNVERSFTETDIKVFATEINKQIIKHMLTVNFGEEHIKQAPKINWKIPSPQDVQETSDALKSFKEFLGPEYKITNIEELAESLGMSIEKTEIDETQIQQEISSKETNDTTDSK